MVCEWGMSKELGPMTFGRREEQVFWAAISRITRIIPKHTALEIDREVRRIIDDAYQKARQLLSDHLALLHEIATRLLDKKCSTVAEVEAMVTAFREGREMPPSVARVSKRFSAASGLRCGQGERAEIRGRCPSAPKPVTGLNDSSALIFWASLDSRAHESAEFLCSVQVGGAGAMRAFKNLIAGHSSSHESARSHDLPTSLKLRDGRVIEFPARDGRAQPLRPIVFRRRTLSRSRTAR